MPDPDPLDIFTEVYAEQTPQLTAQRDGYAAYLDSFEEAQH
jgi:pyruvate dehydrogenase E1 component alpha subunit